MANVGQAGRSEGGHHVSQGHLDADFETKGRALGRDNERKSAYYGPAGGPIGPLGIAFALQRYLWSRDDNLTAPAFSESLAKCVRRVTTSVPEHLGAAHLRGWMQPSRPVALPDPSYAPDVLQALRLLAEEHKLPQKALDALSRSWNRPSDLLTFLRTAPEQDRWIPHFEAIDPLFKSSAPPLGDSSHADLVAELKDFLSGTVARTKVIWIYDPPYSGKRRVLLHLVSQILVDERFIEPHPGERVELFARANCTSIEQIILEIALFLDVQIPTSHTYADRATFDDIDWLLERIAEESEKGDRAYILANVPSAFEPIQSLIRNEALERLIAALYARGAGNRIIVTSCDSVSTNPYIPSGIFHEKTLQSADTKPKTVGYFLQLFGLSEDDLRNGTGKLIDGPLAGLLETLYEQEAKRQEFRPIVHEALKIWDTLPAQPRLLDIAGRNDLRILAQAIYDQIDDPQHRQILRFMATSEDALRIRSLNDAMHKANLAIGAQVDAPTRTHPENTLTENRQPDVSRAASDLVNSLPRLCNIRVAGPWPIEDPPERIVKELEMEFLAPYRRIFEYMLLLRNGDEVHEFRVENAIAAQVTQGAARWARINANALHGMVRHVYIMRIAQGLLRSLLSIDPDALGQNTKDQTQQSRRSSPRIASRGEFERSVLSANLKAPNEVADKFRFLFFEMFRRDIDRGYRLSVEHQRDAIRLSLLLAFCSVGLPVYVNDHCISRHFLSWDKVQNVLTANDCVELLISIAISASRVGVWRVLEEALVRAEVLLGGRVAGNGDAPFRRQRRKSKWLSPPVSLQRIYRRYIDYATLTCGRETDGSGTPFRNLDQLMHYVDMLGREFEDCLTKSHTMDGLSAIIRMKAALGEVLTMKGDFQGAHLAFKIAEELDVNILKETDGATSSAWPSPALSGQAARRYMWFLCEMTARGWRDCKADPPCDGVSAIQLVRALQDINLRRLPRHRGEFPAVLLCEAAIAVLERNWVRAERLLLDRLSEQSHLAAVSLTTGIYVDVLSARLALDLLDLAALARTRLPRRENLLSRVKVLIERIHRVTCKNAQDFPIFHLESQLLGARFILQHKDLTGPSFKGAVADPATLLLAARSTAERIGYGLRTSEIKFWQRRLDRLSKNSTYTRRAMPLRSA